MKRALSIACIASSLAVGITASAQPADPAPPAGADPADAAPAASPAAPDAAPSPTAAPEAAAQPAARSEEVPPAPPPKPSPPPPAAPTAPPPGRAVDERVPAPEPVRRGGAALSFIGQANPLRTSYFGWTTLTSTSLFEKIPQWGDVRMAFAIAPRVSLLDRGSDWVWLGTRIAWRTILTDKYPKRLEPKTVDFSDVPLQLGWLHRFVERDDGLLLRAGPSGTVSLPASTGSRAAELYAKTHPGLTLDGYVPLRASEWLNGLFFAGGAGWSHVFSKQVDPSSVWTGEIARNEVDASFSYWVNLWGDLSLGNTWGVSVPFYDHPSYSNDTCIARVNDGTMCVADDNTATGPVGAPLFTDFDVSLGYAVARLVWLELGYDNAANSIGTDGKRRSVFYSRFDAQLYFSATVMLDAIYERARGPLKPPPPRPMR